jgi:hypothetical protein
VSIYWPKTYWIDKEKDGMRRYISNLQKAEEKNDEKQKRRRKRKRSRCCNAGDAEG